MSARTRRSFTVAAWRERSALPPGLLEQFARDLVAGGLAVELERGRFRLTRRGREAVRAVASLASELEEARR